MDEKLSEFREWLVGLMGDEIDLSGYRSVEHVVEEFDERFGA